MSAIQSDKERAEEICNITHHKWVEEYYGYVCQDCGLFIPYGCEPRLPFDLDDE
jgi:hypothetical protein